MNAAKFITLSATLWAVGSLFAITSAQVPVEPVVPPAAVGEAPQPPPTEKVVVVDAVDETKPAAVPPSAVPTAPGNPAGGAPTGGTPTGGTPTGGTPTGGTPFGPLENQKQEMQKSEEGFIIKDAAINDIFQFLAKTAGRQYFHNAKIAGPEFVVTGHLNNGNPLMQMEELAFMYGLSLHTKGDTIYALTQAQLSQLPSTEFHYQLRYLRPTDMEQIKELIKPMLSPGTGIVNFEPKTNTIIIIDSAHRIEQARALLYGIDKAKGQIIVETKILRVNTSAGERSGVNWASSLGKDGTNINITSGLNSIFGLDSPIVTTTSRIISGSTLTTPPPASTTTNSNLVTRDSTITSGPNLVLSPLQLTGVLRALNEGNLARQVSNPTLITEDNEQATISIIDRVPIITSTTTPGGNGSQPIVTEEVRYKIDQSDKSIDTDPDKHREIGISLVVTPTLLPDGTVRMKMRPRSAQIVENVKSITGNIYPRVTESMVETLARVPDGYSLVVGGFYGEAEGRERTKIPILGDIPILNFFFKSKDTSKEQASLIFIVTPKSYNPTSVNANRSAHNRMRAAATIDCDADWLDPDNPGPAHEPNMRRTLRGMAPAQAPYYPRIGESTEIQPAPRTKTQFSRASRL